MTDSFLRWFIEWWKGDSSRGSDVDSDSKSKSDCLASLLADDDLSWLHPPRDVHGTEAWNKYWFDQIRHGLGPSLSDMFCQEDELISVMRRRGLTTVLCAGNGISQEPRALAEAGLHVTAMDSSLAAMNIAEACQLDPQNLQRFFSSELSALGGSVEFVAGDLRDSSVCPGPFDVIIERCTLQLFPPNERGQAWDALADRLRPDGIFLSHCHNGGWRPDQPRCHLFESLFIEKGWVIEQGDRAQHSDRRVAWLSLSTG